jgi:AP-3 complex subunit delta-1
MSGYEMAWAAFHIVSVMSSSRFHHKRMGYFAAGLTFKPETEILLLTTNLMKKVRFGNTAVLDAIS